MTELIHNILTIYLVTINIFTFIVFWHDKRMAVKNIWRIPESILLVLAGAGGSVGALIGMYTFRHKTRKPKFKYGIPVIIILQILFIAAIGV